MLLREFLNRTGEGKAAVVGWGRGMGHKGHMYLADAVITQAKDERADPYFVVSRTVGKDDPITPEEKLAIYQKVFPKHGHIFHTATEEMPDLTRVLRKLNEHGYTKCTVVVGADQVNALSYVKKYNGVQDKEGNIPFNFTDGLEVISRQMTKAKTANIEGPRATPMRAALKDPNISDDEKFQIWRDAMSPELSDDEVRDLMHKAGQRMSDPAFGKATKKPKKEKFNKPPQVDNDLKDKKVQQVFTRSDENLIKYANKVIREMRAKDFVKEGKITDLHADHEAVMKGVSRSRDVGGYDRVYHMNRLMMAMAMADGKSTKAVDSPAETWYEKYNTHHPLTKEEDNMIRAAMNTVPTDGQHISTFGKSVEPKGGNTQSIVAKPKRNKYGV